MNNVNGKKKWHMSIGFTSRNGSESRIEADFTGIFSYLGRFITMTVIVLSIVIAVVSYPLAWVLVKTHLIPPNSEGNVMNFKFDGK